MGQKICSKCGREIEMIKVEHLDFLIPNECQCQKDKKEREHQEMTKSGYEIIKQGLFSKSGVSKRYKNISLKGISTLEEQKNGYDRAIQFLEDQKSKEENIKGFGFFGGVGSGKSYIVSALANDICNNLVDNTTDKQRLSAYNRNDMLPKQPIRLKSHIELMEALKEENQNMTIYKKAKILVIDDLGAARNTEWASERLLEIIDYRYNQLLPVIFTTNLTPKDLKEKINNRIFDRLVEMCDFVSITAQSQRKNHGANSH